MNVRPKPPADPHHRAQRTKPIINTSTLPRRRPHYLNQKQIDVLSQPVFEKPSGEPECYIDKQVAVAVETARRLSCSFKVVTALMRKGEPPSTCATCGIGRSNRAISTGIRRALGIRDGVCQFPGGDCQHHLGAHHYEYGADATPIFSA